MEVDIWTYRSGDALGTTIGPSVDLTGYKVEALDGSIGKIDEVTYETGSSQIVVDTGPWIFGKKVLLPAGVVDRIDAADEKVFVHRSKEQIKNAPEYDDSVKQDDTYRSTVGDYYGSRGAGWRDWDDRAF